MNQQELEESIRLQLPRESEQMASVIANIIMRAYSNHSSDNYVINTNSPEIQKTIKRLSGQKITADRATISFGENNQVGDITIGNIAGGDIVKMTVNVSNHSQAYKNVFTNIWYTNRKYQFWEARDPDIGTLTILDDTISYQGEKHSLLISNIVGIAHVRQGGSINSNWIEIKYGDPNNPLLAYFAQAKKLGIGELIGGSEELFLRVKLVNPRASERQEPISARLICPYCGTLQAIDIILPQDAQPVSSEPPHTIAIKCSSCSSVFSASIDKERQIAVFR